MPTLRTPRAHESDERAVRCLQIVEYTYRTRSPGLDALAAMTGADLATVAGDIDSLKDGGMQIYVDEDGHCLIDQQLPGFSIRLTTPEARVAWACLTYFNRQQIIETKEPRIARSISAAAALLASGLRTFYPETDRAIVESEPINASPTIPQPADPAFYRWEDLGGEARRTCKRLRMIELIENGLGKRRAQLAALTGASDRTIGHDIGIARAAGFQIEYVRSQHRYVVDTLHTFLDRQLSFSGEPVIGAAILAICSPADTPRHLLALRPWTKSASAKLNDSVRMIFRYRSAALDRAIAGVGTLW